MVMKKQKTTKISIILLCIMMTLALYGCSSGVGSGTKGDDYPTKKNSDEKDKLDDEKDKSDTDNDKESSTQDSTTTEETTLSAEEVAEIHQKYIEYTAPSDDDVDFMFASDYQAYDLVKLYKAYDACAYEEVLGIDKKITVEDIEEVLKTNDKIDPEYKEFIIQYVKDWLALYPESDLRVFYHNLKTLEIRVISESEMMKETLSTDSAACYLKKENQILLLEGEDFSRESDNYIILTHELTHCARQTSYYDENENHKVAGFYEYYLMGTYAEEGIITNIAYEMQGLGERACFYPFQSSCYRIIMDCIGYDGEDFMNHSVNYLIAKMDEYMGDDQYAYYIVALIDAQASQRYTSYQEVDFTNYQDLYDYLTEMYMKKYLSADMSMEEAEQVYEEFCANIMHNFENMKRKYDITEANFRPAFEEYVKGLGIE